MAGVWADNFGWYTSSQFARYYTGQQESATIAIGPYGRGGGSGVRISGNIGEGLYVTGLSTSGATAILQADFRISTYPAVTNVILAPLDGGSLDFQVSLNLRSDGKLALYRGSALGTLLGTSSYVVPLNTYIHVGLKVTIANSGGSAVVHVWEDGDSAARQVIVVSSADTQDTGSAQWNGFHLGAATGTGNTDWCNFVGMDGSTSYNNDLIGPADVSARFPNGAGAHQDWTPSAGVNHAALVSESTSDDDLSYLEATSTSSVETEDFQDAPFPDRLIAFSVLVGVARTNASATLEAVARQASSDTNGGSFALTSSYVACKRPYNTAPDGTAWNTPAGLIVWNAMQWGFESV